MILSNLSTRDLTRALTVSKHWGVVILDPKSKELRRILFLKPVQATEDLEYRRVIRRRDYKGKREGYPAIVREPVDGSRTMIEVHPSLLPYCRRNTAWIDVPNMCRERIRSVPSSTYLFQPPLKAWVCWEPRGDQIVRSAAVVTFGDLFEELAAEDPKDFLSFSISRSGAVSMAEEDVKIARTAQAMEQLYAEKETMPPEVFQYNRSRIWEGRPAVSEAEFERLKILGIVGPTTTEELDELLVSSEIRLAWN